MDVSMVYAFKNEPLTPKTIQTQGVELTLAHGSIWSKKKARAEKQSKK